MANTLERQSNIEVLRILAMFLVVVAHCNSWLAGGLPDLSQGLTVVSPCRYMVASVASICVVLFVLISGYFSVRINIKSLFTLWSQIVFVYLYLFVLQCIVMGGGNLKGFISCFLAFTKSNWFVKCYLTLLIISPALNMFAENLSRRGWLLFLSSFGLIALVWGCLLPSDASGFNNGYSPLCFILVYMVGRYMRLGYEMKYKKRTYFLCYAVSVLMIFVLLLFKQRWVLNYCNPLLILSASLLFCVFAKWNIGTIRVVNWIASSVFAVFIFHTREPIINWLKDINISMLHNMPYLQYVIMILLVIVAIFVVSILMDKLRALLLKPVYNFISKINISINSNDKFLSIK